MGISHSSMLANHFNLVLWRWGPELPNRIRVYDPSGRLPANQLSWPAIGR